MAEFEAPYGALTCIVSPRFVILFASVRGVPVQQTLETENLNTTSLRRAVQAFVEMLRTGTHGLVDATC